MQRFFSGCVANFCACFLLFSACWRVLYVGWRCAAGQPWSEGRVYSRLERDRNEGAATVPKTKCRAKSAPSLEESNNSPNLACNPSGVCFFFRVPVLLRCRLPQAAAKKKAAKEAAAKERETVDA